jgi:uncharacterized OB-fold protein
MPIEASTCTKCSKTIVPPRTICPYCHSGTHTMNTNTLSDSGSILSYSVLEVPPEGFESPLLLALVELEKGAVVLSMGNPKNIVDVQIGTKVNLKKDEQGRFTFNVVN